MSNQIIRPRRLRTSQYMRDIVAETTLSVNDLIYPIFVISGKNIKKEIPSLKEQYHWSIDRLPELISQIENLKIKAVMLFGIAVTKDENGSESWNQNSVVQSAIKMFKSQASEILVMTDVCLCGYTLSGHCGILSNDKIDNDKTLPLLAKIAVSHAESGADIVAPSGMMDGMILEMRKALDNNNFQDVSIMSYSVKYASAFYGPFREASGTSLKGDRKTYQMDYRNSSDSIIEASLDAKQGADFLMVKPALAYLDIVAKLNDNFDLPIVAYHVSGEYAMVKSASKDGLIDEKETTLEILYSMKRAGANLILTYSALDVAKWI